MLDMAWFRRWQAVNKPAVISLFSGAMGLDLGFERGGFEVRVANDINKYAVMTIKRNRPDIPVIEGDIRVLTTAEVLSRARLGVGEASVVAGGPPCQPFSTAGKRQSIQNPQGSLFLHFVRIVEESQPRFFVMENVKGLVSAALKHVGFYERTSESRELAPEEELGSAFDFVMKRLGQTGYAIRWGVLNAADYGVPQKRERLIVVGARSPPPVSLPEKTHAQEETVTLDGKKLESWLTLREACRGLSAESPEFIPFPSWGKYLEHIPPGGSWINLPQELQKEAMKGAYYSAGGRRGFFRRLSWDEPCPTVVTSPVMKATCLCHPDEARPLSVQEYARIQQFPDSWAFAGPTAAKYAQLGEAVPVGLAYAVSRVIMSRIEASDPGVQNAEPSAE